MDGVIVYTIPAAGRLAGRPSSFFFLHRYLHEVCCCCCREQFQVEGRASDSDFKQTEIQIRRQTEIQSQIHLPPLFRYSQRRRCIRRLTLCAYWAVEITAWGCRVLHRYRSKGQRKVNVNTPEVDV